MCKRGLATMAEALETSSPATLALAKANAATMLKKSSPLKRTAWAASSSLQSMLAMKHLEEAKAKKAVVEPEEDNDSFPSIGWNLDDDVAAPVPINSGRRIETLSSALAILKENDVPAAQPPAKRRRMGEPSSASTGMVRSKAMNSQLSSLANSCSSQQSKLAPLKPLPKFVIGNFGSMVTARSVMPAADLATCVLKTTSTFVNTATNNLNSLLTV